GPSVHPREAAAGRVTATGPASAAATTGTRAARESTALATTATAMSAGAAALRALLIPLAAALALRALRSMTLAAAVAAVATRLVTRLSVVAAIPRGALRIRDIGIVAGASGHRARRMTASTMTATFMPRAPMLGTPARILVRRVFARLAGLFGARRMIALFDLELRRLDEFDLQLQQLLDVAQIAQLVRRHQRDRRARGTGARGAADAVHVVLGHVRQL